MKQQVARFSPHQNGKVFAVLVAVTSLIFLVPFLLFVRFLPVISATEIKEAAHER